MIESIREDAQYVFSTRGIAANPVQCGVTHARFYKWLLVKYGVQCEFRSIKEVDLPKHYPSSQGLDDETFLYWRERDLLIDICATPETGPYVGPNLYDLDKSHLWTVKLPGQSMNGVLNREAFFSSIHWIDLGCPSELQKDYPLFWRGHET